MNVFFTQKGAYYFESTVKIVLLLMVLWYFLLKRASVVGDGAAVVEKMVGITPENAKSTKKNVQRVSDQNKVFLD